MSKFLISLAVFSIIYNAMAILKENEECTVNQIYFPYIWTLQECNRKLHGKIKCNVLDPNCI